MKITLTELFQILDSRAELAALRIERDSLKQQVLELVAGDAAVAAKVTEAFNRSEAVEAKMRAATVGR